MITKKTGILLPYLVCLVGILSDYLTTTIGLGLGFYETNAFHPISAIATFWGALGILSLSQTPKSQLYGMSKNVVVLASFIGVVNNILVITGFFSGLKI